MDVHGSRLHIDVAPPNLVQQLLARENPPGTAQKRVQKAKFGRPETKLPPSPCLQKPKASSDASTIQVKPS